MRNRLIKNQKGDTIMEVLICVAMLGFMLGAAFTLTNRNQLSARASQERSEGVRLAEKQIEYLRSYYAKHNPNVPVDVASNFCFTGNDALQDGGYTVETQTPNHVIDQDLSDGDTGDNEGNYIAECRQAPNGYSYRMNIWEANSVAALALGAEPNTHVVTVRWDNVKGGVQEEVKVYYAVDQISAGMYEGSLAVGGGGGLLPSDFCPNIGGNQDPSDPSYYKEGGLCYTQYSLNIPGNSFYSCDRFETPLNDGADGCFIPASISPAMFAWRNVDIRYPIQANVIHQGQANIQIKYRQYNNAAPAGYSYNVPVYLRSRSPINLNYPETIFNLPAGAPGVEMTYNGTIPVSPDSVNANALGIKWNNNIGIDPNLRIDSIRIYRP